MSLRFGGLTHLNSLWWSSCRLIIQSEERVGIKSFGNPRLLISIFLSGEAFTSAVHPAPPDRLICICLCASYPASASLHKTTMGLLQIYSAPVCVCVCVGECLACDDLCVFLQKKKAGVES